MKLLFAFAVAILLSACAESRRDLADGATGTFAYASPTSYWNGQQVSPIGTLDLPDTTVAEKVPVMLILHGSGGQGYRDSAWSSFFLNQGVGTFRINYFKPRGIDPRRREAGRELPMPTQDIKGAIAFLKTHPRLDTDRLGLFGLSRGGNMVLSSMRFRARDMSGIQPILFVALYPTCGIVSIDRQTTGEKALIIVGTEDDFTAENACVELSETGNRLGKSIETMVLQGATHGFDNNRPIRTRVGGGMISMMPSSEHTRIARERVSTVTREVFKLQ